jgi:hypothetical protein
MKRTCFAVILALLGLAAAPGWAQHKAPEHGQDRLPGEARWEFGAWADDYLVTGTAYDTHTHQVTWTLEARKRVAARHYRAVFFDPDQLEMANVTIHLAPARAEYTKGSRIKATLKVPGKDVLQEVNRVRVEDAGPALVK